MNESLVPLCKRLLLITTALALATCETPGWKLVDPEPPDADSPDAKVLTINVALEDTALARALGWTDGVPGAQISLHRIHDEFSIRTAVTDSSGSVRLNDVLDGRYRIAAYRVLTANETGPTGGLIRAFGAGIIVRADRMVELDLQLRIDQRGSLVMTEFRPAGRYSGPEWPNYTWFQYFKIYNNADTTVYLDGMLWGRTFNYVHDSEFQPCTETDQFRNDPLGIWVTFFHQFPGSGTEYPVDPGQYVTVALDAVDHSVVDPSLPDLSNADFELVREGDTDNPDVPNMPWVGSDHPAYTHGLEPDCTSGPCFLARAVDLESLTRARYPPGGNLEWVRIPMQSVIDVVSDNIWDPSYDQFDPCDSSIPNNVDALEAPTYDIYYDATLSLKRNVLRMAPNGRPVYQDINVSFLDFAERSRLSQSLQQSWKIR
jgi:hypothetical protein